MNRKGKSWPLFVVAILIVLFSLTAILGVSYTYGDTKNVYVKGASDIRFGIDIRGGVDVTFMPAGDVDATDEQMAAAKTVIEDRCFRHHTRVHTPKLQQGTGHDTSL